MHFSDIFFGDYAAFFWGPLWLGGMIGLLIAILIRLGQKPCPHCETWINKHASVCRYCGRSLPQD